MYYSPLFLSRVNRNANVFATSGRFEEKFTGCPPSVTTEPLPLPSKPEKSKQMCVLEHTVEVKH